MYEAEKGTTVPFQQEKISILVSKPIHQLRFTATEEQIVLAVEGGELSVYNVKDIETQVIYLGHTSFLFFFLTFFK